MTILSKVGEFLGSLIFSLALGFLIVFIALANFTQYTTLQPLITNMIETQLAANVTQSQLDLIYLNLTGQCTASSTAVLPLSDNNQIYLNCDDVKNSKSTDIPNLIAKGVFNQSYYKKYECSFLECLQGISFKISSNAEENQKFQIFISAKANEFFTKNQIFLIGATVLGIALIVVSVRVWYKILKIVGVTLLLVGITYLFIPLIKIEVSKNAENQSLESVNLSKIVDTLFAPIISWLKVSLVLGTIFTVTGYVVSYLMAKPEKKQN